MTTTTTTKERTEPAPHPLPPRRTLARAVTALALLAGGCTLVVESHRDCSEWEDLVCPPGYFCSQDGECLPVPCFPACEGRECGPDGCGGTCGEGCSGARSTCDETVGECVEPEFCDVGPGLCWQNVPRALNSTWESQNEYCNTLDLAGSTSWRLPTIDELRSLVRGCPASEPGGACAITETCTHTTTCVSGCGGCSSLGGPGAGGAYWPEGLHGALRDPSGGDTYYWSSSHDAMHYWCLEFTRATFETVMNFSPYSEAAAARCVRDDR
jgi:hypothetical protein